MGPSRVQPMDNKSFDSDVRSAQVLLATRTTGSMELEVVLESIGQAWHTQQENVHAGGIIYVHVNIYIYI